MLVQEQPPRSGRCLPPAATWSRPGENDGVQSHRRRSGGAFKKESHNHPSAVEPYQGAAPGWGDLRDIVAMGGPPDRRPRRPPHRRPGGRPDAPPRPASYPASADTAIAWASRRGRRGHRRSTGQPDRKREGDRDRPRGPHHAGCGARPGQPGRPYAARPAGTVSRPPTCQRDVRHRTLQEAGRAGRDPSPEAAHRGDPGVIERSLAEGSALGAPASPAVSRRPRTGRGPDPRRPRRHPSPRAGDVPFEVMISSRRNGWSPTSSRTAGGVRPSAPAGGPQRGDRTGDRSGDVEVV